MSPVKIILLVIAFILPVLAGFLIASWNRMKKHAEHYKTVGTVTYAQKSKVPFMWNYVVSYTKKGHPYQASSFLTLKNKVPKIGAKGMYDISTYRNFGKSFITAKRING